MLDIFCYMSEGWADNFLCDEAEGGSIDYVCWQCIC